MASGAAAGGGAFDGCLNGRNFVDDQRPYHRNCSCGLCKRKKKKKKKNTICQPLKATIAYPMRRSWSESSLALNAAAVNTSPSSSPVVASAAGVQLRRPKSMLFDVVDRD